VRQLGDRHVVEVRLGAADVAEELCRVGRFVKSGDRERVAGAADQGASAD
jgi:hypothetical protein